MPQTHPTNRQPSASTRPRRAPRQSPPRRGTALIAAVVACAIVATALFQMLKGTLDQHRQMAVSFQQVQADWLVDAGIQRALAQLRQSSSYTGETWQMPAEELSGVDAGQVVIKVEPAAAGGKRQITVQADYPADTIHRSRKTHTLLWSQ